MHPIKSLYCGPRKKKKGCLATSCLTEADVVVVQVARNGRCARSGRGPYGLGVVEERIPTRGAFGARQRPPTILPPVSLAGYLDSLEWSRLLSERFVRGEQSLSQVTKSIPLSGPVKWVHRAA